MIEVDDERRYFRIPSFDTLLKVGGILIATVAFILHLQSWKDSVDRFIANDQVWKGYEVRWFNALCQQVGKHEACVPEGLERPSP